MWPGFLTAFVDILQKWSFWSLTHYILQLIPGQIKGPVYYRQCPSKPWEGKAWITLRKSHRLWPRGTIQGPFPEASDTWSFKRELHILSFNLGESKHGIRTRKVSDLLPSRRNAICKGQPQWEQSNMKCLFMAKQQAPELDWQNKEVEVTRSSSRETTNTLREDTIVRMVYSCTHPSGKLTFFWSLSWIWSNKQTFIHGT